MGTNDINATPEIRGIGRGGVDPSYIAAPAAAALLLQEFDRAELTALLDRVAALHDALKG